MLKKLKSSNESSKFGYSVDRSYIENLCSITVLLVLATLALLSGCSGDRSSSLRIAGQHAADHAASIQLQDIKAEVEAANIGLDVRLFPAGQLGTGEQVFGDVAKGVIDIGHTFIYSHNDPLLEINSIPYLVESYEEMRRVFAPNSTFYQIYSDLLARQGVHLLGIYCEGFIGISTSKLPTNVTGFGEKATTIRVWSASIARETASDLGFSTTTIDWGDVFPALQQGIVDGVMGGTPEANYTMFRDAIDYYIPYNAFVENTAYYMNQESWDSLTLEQQQTIAKVFEQAAVVSLDQSEENDNKFLTLLAESGVEMVKLSAAQRAAISAYIRSTTWPKFENVFSAELLESLISDVE